MWEEAQVALEYTKASKMMEFHTVLEESSFEIGTGIKASLFRVLSLGKGRIKTILLISPTQENGLTEFSRNQRIQTKERERQ